MTPNIRNSWNLLLCSIVCLSPAISSACQDVPADSRTATTSASLADAAPGEFVFASTDGGHDDGHRHFAKQRIDRLFERFDKNGDGKIALIDLPDRLREKLAKADTNNDGYVTRQELTDAWEQRAAEIRKNLDTNGDGVISDQERNQARVKFWETRFPNLDKNQDGSLTVDEVPARFWDHIKVADANGDGKITLAEIKQAITSGTLKPPQHEGRKRGT